MNNPYKVVIRNGIWYRELNTNFKTVDFPSQVVNHNKMMPFRKLLVGHNLLRHFPFQRSHQVHTNNLLNHLLTVEFSKDHKVDVATAGSVQEHRRLDVDNTGQTRVSIDCEKLQ